MFFGRVNGKSGWRWLRKSLFGYAARIVNRQMVAYETPIYVFRNRYESRNRNRFAFFNDVGRGKKRGGL